MVSNWTAGRGATFVILGGVAQVAWQRSASCNSAAGRRIPIPLPPPPMTSICSCPRTQRSPRSSRVEYPMSRPTAANGAANLVRCPDTVPDSVHISQIRTLVCRELHLIIAYLDERALRSNRTNTSRGCRASSGFAWRPRLKRISELPLLGEEIFGAAPWCRRSKGVRKTRLGPEEARAAGGPIGTNCYPMCGGESLARSRRTFTLCPDLGSGDGMKTVRRACRTLRRVGVAAIVGWGLFASQPAWPIRATNSWCSIPTLQGMTGPTVK